MTAMTIQAQQSRAQPIATPSRRRQWSWRPAHWAGSRPAWWSQVILAVVFAWGYDATRALHGNVRAAALSHAKTVAGWDIDLHADWIASLSRWTERHDAIADLLSGYYVVMHLGGVCVVLIVLWIDGRLYRRHRDALLTISAIGFVVFWLFPVAPPRLSGMGYADSVRHVLPFAYSAEASAANLYAALPSLHVAWALWATIALWSVTRRPWVRVLAVAHSVITAITVLATGNHYLVDVIAGAALTPLGYAALRLALSVTCRFAPQRVRAWRPRTSVTSPLRHDDHRELSGADQPSGYRARQAAPPRL